MIPKRMVIGLVIALGVVVGLGGLVLVGPAKTEKGSETRVLPYSDSRNRTLRDVTTGIRIRREGAEVVLEKMLNGRWSLGEPVSDRADQGAVTGILDTLRDLERDRSVPLGGDREKYGLDKPRVEVTLEGEGVRSFSIGRDTRGRSRKEKRVYLHVAGTDRVDVVDASVLNMLHVDSDVFRERRVFPQGVIQARRLKIAGPAGTVAIEDVRQQWNMTEPREGTVASDRLVELLKVIHELRIERFVENPTGARGLERPTFSCTLDGWDGTTTTLEVGFPMPESKEELYARRAGEAAVFTVTWDSLAGLRVDPAELCASAEALNGEEEKQ